MRYVGLYHLNAYTYGDPTWFPDMDPRAARHVQRGHARARCRVRAGQPATRRFQDQRPIRRHTGSTGRAWSAFRSSTATSRRRRSTILTSATRPRTSPFFMSVNFMKVHQPNMPAPRVTSINPCRRANTPTRWSSSTPASAGSWTRFATLGLDKNTLVVLHDRQRRLARRLPRCRLHTVPRHQGHRARRRQSCSRDCHLARQNQA